VHYALHEAPEYRNGAELSKTLFQRMFPSVQEVVDHCAEVAMNKMPSRPFLHCLCWTKRDPTRAPDGKHCVTIDTFPPCELRDGRSWEDAKEEFAAVMLAMFREHTTNMDDSNILGYAIHTPEDLYAYNRSFYKGSPTGGERTLAQLGCFRPFPGYSQYRSPIDKLYMTGPSTHPGGGISAMSTIAANVMLEDFGLKEPDDL
jgi:phytoene dehydrogenase-like protein